MNGKRLIPLAEIETSPHSPLLPFAGSCSLAKATDTDSRLSAVGGLGRQSKICQRRRLLHSARCFIRFPWPGTGRVRGKFAWSRKKFNQRYKLIPREFIKFSKPIYMPGAISLKVNVD